MARTKDSEKRFKLRVNLRDSYYGQYRKNDPNKTITCQIYLQIVEGFILHLLDMILKGKEVKLPCTFGTMEIIGRKLTPWIDKEGHIKGVAVDKRATFALWRRDPIAREARTTVHYLNEHTSGYSYKLKWNKKDCKIKNRFNYFFRFCRNNKKAVSNLINNKKEFITL